MREIRQSGSEGGGAETNRLSLPLFGRCVRTAHCRLDMNDPPTRWWNSQALPLVMSVSTFQHSARLMTAPGFFHIEQDHRRVEIEYTWTDLKKLRALERKRLSSADTI